MLSMFHSNFGSVLHRLPVLQDTFTCVSKIAPAFAAPVKDDPVQLEVQIGENQNYWAIRRYMCVYDTLSIFDTVPKRV